MSKNRSKRSKRAALHERSKHANYCRHYIRIHKTKYVEVTQCFFIFIRRVKGNVCICYTYEHNMQKVCFCLFTKTVHIQAPNGVFRCTIVRTVLYVIKNQSCYPWPNHAWQMPYRPTTIFTVYIFGYYIFGYYLPPRRHARWITQSDLEKSGISGSWGTFAWL
jgi:hypothetical protein